MKTAGPDETAERRHKARVELRANATASKVGAVSVPHTQTDYVAPALALAEQLGWSGPEHYVLDGIRVADAQRYLCKVHHEAHVAARHPGRVTMPTVAAVAAHLGVEESDERHALLEAAITNLTTAELAEAAQEGA